MDSLVEQHIAILSEIQSIAYLVFLKGMPEDSVGTGRMMEGRDHVGTVGTEPGHSVVVPSSQQHTVSDL